MTQKKGTSQRKGPISKKDPEVSKAKRRNQRETQTNTAVVWPPSCLSETSDGGCFPHLCVLDSFAHGARVLRGLVPHRRTIMRLRVKPKACEPVDPVV